MDLNGLNILNILNRFNGFNGFRFINLNVFKNKFKRN